MNTYRSFSKNLKYIFATSTVRTKTILSNPAAEAITAELKGCSFSLKRCTATMNGPRGTLQRLESHHCGTKPTRKEKRSHSALTNGGEIERNWQTFTL